MNARHDMVKQVHKARFTATIIRGDLPWPQCRFAGAVYSLWGGPIMHPDLLGTGTASLVRGPGRPPPWLGGGATQATTPPVLSCRWRVGSSSVSRNRWYRLHSTLYIRVHVRNMYMYGVRPFPAVHEIEKYGLRSSRAGTARGSATCTRRAPEGSQGDQAPTKPHHSSYAYARHFS